MTHSTIPPVCSPRRRAVALTFLVVAAFAPGLTACGDDDMTVDPAFPMDYEASYTEVRNCRQSGDHDLNIIRILVDPDALTAYRDRSEPFPVGSVVLKEERDFADTDCTGPITQWTVMQKLEVGSSPATLDWYWQRVEAERMVVDEDPPRCIACHTGCGVGPDGYDGTCAMP